MLLIHGVLIATVFIVSCFQATRSHQSFFARVENSGNMRQSSDAAITVDFHKCSQDESCTTVFIEDVDVGIEEWKKLTEIDERCLPGYRFYNQKCYKFSTEQLTWYKAQEKCSDNGGSLVKITSMLENTFLGDQIKSDAWIGLYTNGQNESNWVSDGQYPTFSNIAGQFAHFFMANVCAAMLQASAKWTTHDCSSVKAYICENDARN